MVVESGPGYAWVETRRRSTCATCSLNAGCGTAALARFLGSRRTRVRALSGAALSPGQEVVIGLEEGALLRGSLAVYLVPLGGLILGAAAGDRLFAGSGEEPSVLLGIVGLVAGLLWQLRYGRAIHGDRRFQPVVLRCLPGSRE